MPAILKVLGIGGSGMVSYEIKVSASRVWYSAQAPARIECERWVKVCKCFAKSFAELEPILRNPVTELWVSTSRNSVAAVSNGRVLCTVCLYGHFAVSYVERALVSLFNKVFQQESWS